MNSPYVIARSNRQRLCSFSSIPFLCFSVLFLIFLLFARSAVADDVTLAWDANPEPYPDGYMLYYKTGSCCAPYDGVHPTDPTLDSPIDVGDITQYTIYGLSNTETYYFVVTAYDTDHNESGYSNEVSYIPSTLDLSSLSISGDDSVKANSSESYTATATFGDDSTQIVTNSTSWSVDSSYASINSSGVLTTSEISIGETVTISIQVSNTGEEEGSYAVTLKINEIAEETKEITLAGGASETVTFTTSGNKAGSYSVDVDGLTGSFTVKEVVEEPPPPAPPEVKPEFNWPVLGGIIGGVVVVALIVFFVVRRRRAY